MRMWIALLLASLALPAHAQQPVQQSGAITPGHAAQWNATGVIQDGGTADQGSLTSLGVTNSGAGICQNSDLVTASGWQQICLGATTAGGGFISVQNFGTAPAQGLSFNINGVTVALPSINLPTALNDFICAADSAGTLKDCGFPTVPVTAGGTGATTATNARLNLGIGTVATQNANAVAITGGTVTGLPNPTNPTDATNKQYVDGVAQGLVIHTPVRLATAAILPNTPTYSNGTAGVGATLTAGSNTSLTVDGTVANLNDRVLVKNQASPAQNGAYSLTTAGDGSHAWVLTRVTDFDTSSEMLTGSYFLVTAGSTNANSSWVLTATVATVGTDPANFNQFAGASTGVTSATIAAGTGITATGTCTITTTGTCTVALDGNISNGSRVHNNGVDISYTEPSPNNYIRYSPSTAVFNQGGYWATSCPSGQSYCLTPPAGARLVSLNAQIWATGGLATSGNFVAKWIKNYTVDINGFQTSGADVCAGIGAFSNGFNNQVVMRPSCLDAPNLNDYYGLFLFLDGASGPGSVIKIDGNPAHSYLSMEVMRF